MDMPTVEELKQGVGDAMRSLMWLTREYSDRVVLPRDVQGYANALVVGVIYCNGFGGRCKEWGLLTKEHFMNQTKRERDYVVCSTHKTSHIYGDLAKWLAPGTTQAMLEYLKLPRRDDVTTFLHPATTDTPVVDVHHALKMFAARVMPANREGLTVNLLRKWYHTRLMKMCRTEHDLMERLARFDAHSGVTAARSYILLEPEDDANLAKMLVESVLGKCVPWPEPHDVPGEGFRPKGFDPTQTTTETTDVTYEASDEEELEWFQGAELFGIPEPLMTIKDIPDNETCFEETAPTQVLAQFDRDNAPPPQAQDSTLCDTLPLPDTVPIRDAETEAVESLTQPRTPDVAAAHAPTQWDTQPVSATIPLTVDSSQEAVTPPRRDAGSDEPTDTAQLTLHDLGGARWTQIPPPAPAWDRVVVSPQQSRLTQHFTRMPASEDFATQPVRERSRSPPPTTAAAEAGGSSPNPKSSTRSSRRHMYTDEEIAYILEMHEHLDFTRDSRWFVNLAIEGKQDLRLSEDCTPAGMRTLVARRVQQEKDRRAAEEAEVARRERQAQRRQQRRTGARSSDP